MGGGGGELVAGVSVGRATGVVYLPGLGFMCSPGGAGHWAPNLHLRLTLLNINRLTFKRKYTVGHCSVCFILYTHFQAG